MYDSNQGTRSVVKQGVESSATAKPGVRPFSRPEAKRLVQDLLTPKPLLYWIDFLMTVSIGYGCAAVYLTAPAFSPMQIIAFLLSGPALFRAGIFYP